MKKIIATLSVIVLLVLLIVPAIGSAITASIAAESTQAAQEASITEGEYNEAVEVYRDTVITYCSAYGITDYTDIIMKMLSIYSFTHSTDVLNASYSYLNKKYEHRHEGITDSDYSIRTGINQLSEWAQYIKSTYNTEPIADNEYLMVLLQAYDLQDKGYIDYALRGNPQKGYSASDVVDYCNSDKFNSEKSISAISSTFATDVVNMIIGLSGISLSGSNEELNDIQKKIVEIALDYKNYSKNGVKAKGGYCLRFANDVVQAAGLNIKRADCARCSGAYYGVSNDWSIIPVGALVYCNASQQYGHVGVYIGDGYVVHCTTYKNKDATLLKTVDGGYVLKQSLASFVSSYKGKCWGFSGAWTKQYPCQPGKYMTALH